jgi:FkbM family methyltransferase
LRYAIEKFFLLWIRGTASDIGQDKWVVETVLPRKRNGFFVELGGFDGVTLSNTLLLEKRYGWSGICIEPDPSAFRHLLANRQCTCVNTAIGAHSGTIEFVPDGVLGRVQVGGGGETPPSQTNPSIRVPVRPLAAVLSEHRAPTTIDYLSLDVEGYEEEVLLGFPFQQYRFLCMTVERPTPALQTHLRANGYVPVISVPMLDTFFIHESLSREYRNRIQVQHWNWLTFKLNSLLRRTFLG